MTEHDKITAKQRYDRTWPPISVRVPKETHDLLKNLAERKGLPIGRFCGDILMLQHCGNCRSVFRRKQPPKIVEELKAALDDIKAVQEKNKALADSLEDQEELRSFEEKNKALADSLVDWQVYCSTLQNKLDESQKSNLSIQADSDALKRQNADLLARTRSLEDVIQGYKDSNAALQEELVQLKDKIYILKEEVAEGQESCNILDIDEDEVVEGQESSDLVDKLRAALYLDGEDEGKEEPFEDLEEGQPVEDLEDGERQKY